jgi:hypothetical protein
MRWAGTRKYRLIIDKISRCKKIKSAEAISSGMIFPCWLRRCFNTKHLSTMQVARKFAEPAIRAFLIRDLFRDPIIDKRVSNATFSKFDERFVKHYNYLQAILKKNRYTCASLLPSLIAISDLV